MRYTFAAAALVASAVAMPSYAPPTYEAPAPPVYEAPAPPKAPEHPPVYPVPETPKAPEAPKHSATVVYPVPETSTVVYPVPETSTVPATTVKHSVTACVKKPHVTEPAGPEIPKKPEFETVTITTTVDGGVPTVVTKTLEKTDVPSAPTAPVYIPEGPKDDAPKAPEVPGKDDAPKAPEVPGKDDAPKAPETPKSPETPVHKPEQPAAPYPTPDATKPAYLPTGTGKVYPTSPIYTGAASAMNAAGFVAGLGALAAFFF